MRLLSLIFLVLFLLAAAFPVSAQSESCAIDLMLALDGSGSISPTDFEMMKNFVRQLVASFSISPSGANVGIIQFSDTAELYLSLSEDPNQVNIFVNAMTQFGNRTDIAGAIQLAQGQFEIRRNIPRVIILLTDGLHNMAGNPIAQADIARAQGSSIIGIAVGTFDQTEITAISGGQENVFYVADFNSLGGILDRLVNATCSTTLPTPPPLATPFVQPTTPPLAQATVSPSTPTLPPTPQQDISYVGQIAFSSNRTGNFEIFVMNDDGTNLRQLTVNDSTDDYPAWSPDGTQIAWESNMRGGNFEIWVMNADGTGQTRLTDNPSDDWGPAWSPDGSQIAFYSSRTRNQSTGIFVMDADGSNVRQVSNATRGGIDSSPTWSPDGTRILYFSDKSGGRELYAIDINTGGEQQLTNDEVYDGYPDYSPDGTQIVWGSNRSPNENRPDIFVMNADGTNSRMLTDQLGTDDDPVWSPDGSRIAFHSGRNGNFDIFTMNASDGSDLRQLTSEEATDSSPSWALVPVVGASVATVSTPQSASPPLDIAPAGPRDTQIAFASDRDGDFEIFVMDGDGQNVRQLTQNRQTDDFPAWSPDGRLLAWESNTEGTFDIWVMNNDGSDQRRISTSNSNERGPAWSPDGSQIAYYSDQGGDDEIWVMNADGSNARQITSNRAFSDRSPVWSGDGTQLLYYSDKSGGRELYIIDLLTNAERQLTSNQVYDGQPDWSWISNQIVFGTTRSLAGDEPDLYIMDATGQNVRQLTNELGTDDDPAWSPDGLQIAFQSGRSGNLDIWIVDSDGKSVLQLTTHPAADTAPTWSWKP